MEIKELFKQGLSITQIAKMVHRDRKTVRRIIEPEEPAKGGAT